MSITIEIKKQNVADWFTVLQNRICETFETIETELNGSSEPIGKFEHKPWQRENSDAPNTSGSILKGGGEMRVMKGRVFEKVGVNVSKVHGTFSPEFASKIPGAEENNGRFWASGISIVAHMHSPLVPAIHMNTRMIATSKSWFGGGIDLTPMIKNIDNETAFHAALSTCCSRHDVANYLEFKKWCDEYFYLPHREEPRGVGGIFYDYMDGETRGGSWEDNFKFTKDVGETFLDIYPKIVRAHMNESWTDEQREAQLVKRGRYVEFNLLYDRGTMFGLKTGGNTEAILMSMPPEVKWS